MSRLEHASIEKKCPVHSDPNMAISVDNVWWEGTGLENQDYGCGGSAALTKQHPFIRKSWQ
jgi:hypothetical protein